MVDFNLFLSKPALYLSIRERERKREGLGWGNSYRNSSTRYVWCPEHFWTFPTIAIVDNAALNVHKNRKKLLAYLLLILLEVYLQVRLLSAGVVFEYSP
jgi:hypothetical protein